MSVTVNGTVKAPAAVLTHTEPTSPYTGNVLNSGAGLTLNLGPFKNTGNVNQTLTLNGVSAVTNCVVDDFHISHDGVANDGHSRVLAPNAEVSVIVLIEAPAEAPGTPDATYSFTLDTAWS